MKIKDKKEMTLLQLIEWAWENGIKDEAFFSSDNRMKSLYFNALGRVEFSDSDQFSSYDTFTVITEEEITEDTVIPVMLVIFSDGVTDLTNNKRLNDLSGTNLKSAYIMNDDLRLILIWRDGRLVN